MGKKYVESAKLIDRHTLYSPAEAMDLCVKTAKANFDETIELHVRLGVDPRHADQQVRGAVVLPNGTGKTVKVLVFAKGEKAKEAEAAGADYVGAEELVQKIQSENWFDFDVVVGAESRGFIFGMPIAYNMKKSFVPIRKKGKLPAETIEESYDLEYGQATLEMHKDAIKPGQKVVIVDDLIATGGTAEAMIKLVEKLGGEVVQLNFLIELSDLNGRKKLSNYDIKSCIQYKGE